MTLMMQSYTFVGDDIVYSTAMNHYVERYGVAGWPAYCAGHWISTNGRLANFLAPVFISALPRWITNICVGISYALLIILILRSVNFGKNYFCSKSILIGLTVLTLPWYDDFLLYDCWLNYVVAIVFNLWWLQIWNRNSHSVLLLIIIGFAAAMMHESCSVSISVGILIRLLISKRTDRKLKQKLFAASAYWLGCALCVTSPGMMSRMAANPHATERFEVLFTSNFYIVLLAIIVIFLLFIPRGRKVLRNLISSNWCIYVFAAMAGCIISVFSGIAGRSGFFAQVFAMIALFSMLQYSKVRIHCIAAAIIGSVFLIISILQMIYTLHIQSCIAHESREMSDLIEQSNDGVVYHNMEVSYNPPVLTLGKCVAYPKRTEVWKYSILKSIFPSNEQIIILPGDFRDIDFSSGNIMASYKNVRIIPADGLSLKDTILMSEGLEKVKMYGYMLATPVQISGNNYVVLDPM